MAPRTCAVRGCHSRDGDGTTMFRFPKDPVRAQLWLDACNRGDLFEKTLDSLHNNYKLCQLHFEDKFISKRGRKKYLCLQAVPTIVPWLKRKGHVILSDPPTKIAIQSDTMPFEQVGHSSEAATSHNGDASQSLDTMPFEQVGHSSQATTTQNIASRQIVCVLQNTFYLEIICLSVVLALLQLMPEVNQEISHTFLRSPPGFIFLSFLWFPLQNFFSLEPAITTNFTLLFCGVQNLRKQEFELKLLENFQE